jgi:hypothetical protein
VSQSDDEKLFRGLDDRLRAEPVSIEKADQRVNDLLDRHIKGRTGRLTFVIDASLPPETVIRVEGSTVTMSQDAFDALERHQKRTGVTKHPLKTVRRQGQPYRGS